MIAWRMCFWINASVISHYLGLLVMKAGGPALLM